MNRTQYVQRVREIAQETPSYRSGGDGSDGTCDCVGLGIGALRRGGVAYKSLHGANWAARHEAVNLRRIANADDLRAGDNVLKAYEPGDLGYALPDRYKNDADQRDYYHMGVVVSVSPLVILHCTTPTVKTDKALGKWKYAFCWKQLTDDEEQTMSESYKAVVTTRRDPLTLRSAPEGDRIGKLPRGAVVDVLDTAVNAGWWRVRYGALVGYASCAYLRAEETPQPSRGDGSSPDEGSQEELIAETGEAPCLPSTGEVARNGTEGFTTLVREDAEGCIMLAGCWRVAED